MCSKKNLKIYLILFLGCYATLSSEAKTMSNLSSGSWYDGSIWEGGRVPSTLDVVTIKAGTNVSAYGDYADCDSLTINGFFDVGPTNFTVGGRELYTDSRAIRNTSCVVNGGLRIIGNYNTQFKVYGNVKFNAGSTFEMSAGKIMIDGAAFTPELSVPADKALLDVTDVASFSHTGGLIIIFNPHYFQGGLSIRGAKNFGAVSFGNNSTLTAFAARTTNDFFISETEQPTIKDLYVHYLPNPNRQNKVVLNPNMAFETLQADVGVLAVKSGRLKFSKEVLLNEKVLIECDIELAGVGEQKIGMVNNSNKLITVKGNITINNPSKVQCTANIELLNGTINFLQGKIDLTDKTITVARPPTGFNDDSYFISKNNYTNNGTLLIKNLQGATTFPVGTNNDYLPAVLTAYGSDFSVSARALQNNPNNGSFPINMQWDIKRTAGSSNAHVQLQWTKAVEDYSFAINRQGAHIYRGELDNWYALPNWTWGITNNNNAIFSQKANNVDNFTSFTILTETVIPVELKNFVAKKQANNAVSLTWETATEINNAGFDVEKSADGQRFSPIGFVKGAGNSMALNRYDFTDNNVVGTVYYRLKQFDNNGKTTYSAVVSVQKAKSKLALNVFPNLITTEPNLTIDFTNASDAARAVSIFDVNGRLVFYKNNIAKDVPSVIVPVADFAKGVYLIAVKNGLETIGSKFVKN